MIPILILVIVLCLTGIMLGRRLPGGRVIAIFATGVLSYLVSLIGWWLALYLQIVPLDRILAQHFNVYRAGGAPFLIAVFVPPLLPVAFLLLLWGWRSRRS